MSLGESIRKGTKWLVAGSLAGQVLQFAFGIVLARLLVPADFGMIVTIQVFTGVVGLIASGGMGQALVQAKVANQHDYNVVFTAQLAINLVVYAAFFFLSPFIADWFGDTLYKDLVRMSALSFLMRPLIATRSNWLHREMRFRERSIAGLSSSIFGGIISIAMAWAGLGVLSLILSGLAGSLLNVILLSRLTPQQPALVIDMATMKRFGSYGLKVSLNDIMGYATRQVSNMMISRMIGPSAVGLFNKGESLAWLPFNTVSGSVYDTVFRAMSTVQDNADQTKYMFFRMITLLVVYTLPFYIGLAWMAGPFIDFVYGTKWLPAAEPLRIIALAGLLICIGHPCGAVLAAQNRLGREVWVHASHVLVVAAGCYVGLRWGIVGAAWAVFIGLVYSSAIMYYLATRCFRSTLGDLGRALAPGLKLNALLITTLVVSHILLPADMRHTHAAQYMLIVGGSGGLVYAAAFLFLPIPALAAEAERWRKTIRLAR